MDIIDLWLLITVIPGFNGFTEMFSAISGILLCFATVIFLVNYSDCSDDEQKFGKKVLMIWTICWCIASTIALILPSESQLKYIAGGYIVTNAEDVAKLPDNMTKAANKFLEDIATEPDE